jgi:hypothetical protein
MMRYQFAVLPGPPFHVSQKGGEEGGNDRNVHELYLPMKHSVISRVGRLRTTQVSARRGDANIPLWGDSELPL